MEKMANQSMLEKGLSILKQAVELDQKENYEEVSIFLCVREGLLIFFRP